MTPISKRMCKMVWDLAKEAPVNPDIVHNHLIAKETRDRNAPNVIHAHVVSAMSKHKITPETVCEKGCNLGFYLATLADLRYLEAAEQLGVNFAHRNNTGETPLFYLFASGPMFYLFEYATQPQKCLDFLLRSGKLTDTNTLGQTPLFGLHKMMEKDEMFSHIISQYLRSITPLEHAEYIRHYEKLLHWAVKRGADIAHKDHANRCFLDPDPLDSSGLNDLLALFGEWRNQIQNIVLTKTVASQGVTGCSAKRRL